MLRRLRYVPAPPRIFPSRRRFFTRAAFSPCFFLNLNLS
jgi:hypothetical protein